jgi:hypothetical protein
MASRTANKRPLREAPRIPAAAAVMITVAIWVYCSKTTRRAHMSNSPREAAFSPSAVHSCCSFKQEWLFRAPADTIGRHHNRKKLQREPAIREAFLG